MFNRLFNNLKLNICHDVLHKAHLGNHLKIVTLKKHSKHIILLLNKIMLPYRIPYK